MFTLIDSVTELGLETFHKVNELIHRPCSVVKANNIVDKQVAGAYNFVILNSHNY